MVLPVKAKGLICPNCDDIIFSRAHHDYHSCTCGAISVDGGFDYMHYGWHNHINFDEIIPVEIKFDEAITKQVLYDDWNFRKNKFGIINVENGGYRYVCEIKCSSPKK